MKNVSKLISQLFSRQSLCFLAASLLSILLFDLLWAAQTTFRAFSLIRLYMTLAIASLLLWFPYLLTRKIWVETLVLLIADFFLIANLMYCRTYFTAIPFDSYFMASNLSDFLPSVVDSFRPLDLLLPSVTIVSALLARRWKNSEKQEYSFLAPAAVFTLAAILIFITSFGWSERYRKLKEGCYFTTCTTPLYTPLGDVIYQYLHRNHQPSPSEIEEIDQWLAEHASLTCALDFLGIDSAAQRDNIVLIFCESLESWPLETKAGNVEITPYLNTLLADSATLYCPRVVTQVGNGRSIDAQLLINAGMMPMENSVFSMTYPGNLYFPLNQALNKKNNARSYLLTCDKPVTWNQLPIARSFGIDTLLDKSSWRNDELVGSPAKLSDGSFMLQTVEKLRNEELWPAGTNAFLQIITYSGHNPFRLPERLKTVEFQSSLPERLRNYMEMAHYTDASLRPLIEYLKTRPDYDRTIIVITGDHEGLAKTREEILRNPDAAKFVSSEQLTPLIILNSPVSGRYTEAMGQIDIYPTLIQLMGLSAYKWQGMGQSIFSENKPHYAIVTMTGEIVGDTISVDQALRDHIAATRHISDNIIKYDYFRRQR